MLPTTMRSRAGQLVAPAILAAVALLVGLELARPLGPASVAYDSQVSVLHFDRLYAGQRLEAFLPTTPKPFLTFVFGSLFELTGDWRTLAWATLLAYGVGVGLVVVLARRLGGSVAGVFAGAAILVAPSILFDVGFALATPWAMVCWLTAGLAVTSSSPRYGLAGAVLALAALARLETLALTATIAGVLLLATVAPPLVRRWGRPPRRAWLVPVVGSSAIVVLMVHDLLLTGDPLFWATVSRIYTERTSLHVPTTLDVIGLIVSRYWSLGALSLLAIVGGASLVRDRAWPAVLGLVGLGPAVAAFLVALAVRGIFVSDRYLAAVDLALAFAAGIGAAAIVRWATSLDRDLMRSGSSFAGMPPARAGGLVAVGLIAVLLAGPYWEVDPDLRASVSRSRRLAADSDRSVQVIRPELDTIPGAHDPIGPDDVPPEPLVLGPGPIQPRLVVDLDVSIPTVSLIRAAEIDVGGGYPEPGRFVIHSLVGDAPAPEWSELEVTQPTVIGDTRVVPLIADGSRGLWVLRLEDARP